MSYFYLYTKKLNVNLDLTKQTREALDDVMQC